MAIKLVTKKENGINIKKKIYFSPCFTFYGSVAQITTTGTGAAVENAVPPVLPTFCAGGATKKYCGL